MAAQTRTLRRLFPAMESGEYRKLFYAAGLSAISLWALITARGWVAYDLTGSTTASGAVTFAAIGPWVLAPLGGALADRYDRARVVMLCRFGAALTAATLAILAFTGTIELWNLVLVTLISGIIRSGEMPAQAALLPNTVKGAALLSAITLASMMQFGSKVVGPVAGPVLEHLGAGWVFAGASLILLLSVWQMMRIKVRSTGGIEASADRGILRDTANNIRDGLAYLGRAPMVRLTIGLVALHCMLTMAFDLTLLPAYADRVLGGGSTEFGYLLMGFGGGALVATVTLSAVPGGRIRGRLLLVVGLLSGAALTFFGLVDSLLLAIVAGVITGASTAMFMALSSVMVQAVVPDTIRGRVMSLYAMFAGGVMSVSALVSSLAADYVDLRLFAVVPGIIFVIVMLVFLIGLPRIRSIIRHGEITEIVPDVVQAAAAGAAAGAAAMVSLIAARSAPQQNGAARQPAGRPAIGGD